MFKRSPAFSLAIEREGVSLPSSSNLTSSLALVSWKLRSVPTPIPGWALLQIVSGPRS